MRRENPSVSGRFIIIIFLLFFTTLPLYAWDIHYLITLPLLKGVPGALELEEVTVSELEDFLVSVEKDLELLLSQEEEWAKDNLEWYPPLQKELSFKATGNREDIVERFLKALRFSPLAKQNLYLFLPPFKDPGEKTLMAYEEITFLTDIGWLSGLSFFRIRPGESVNPLEVCATASDEPDFGLDIGLFRDNGTPWGDTYGFGEQAFGNPNLEYGSQAPVHMGIYHEPRIIYAFAPFLKNTLPELRIRQCKVLAELAFQKGYDYWGWRFTGWGLHYLADLSQPYHVRILPGAGVVKMLGINLLNLLGFEKPFNDTVQLVSNRHLALELFERETLMEVFKKENWEYSHIKILSSASEEIPPYHDDLPREVVSEVASSKARYTDRIIKRSFPKRLVSDPSLELTIQPEAKRLREIVIEEKGIKAKENLENLIGELLQNISLYGKSYILSILEKR